MAKWKIIYKDQTEDIVECDFVQLDTSGNCLVFAKTSGVQIPAGTSKEVLQAAKIVRFVNRDAMIEAFDASDYQNSRILTN